MKFLHIADLHIGRRLGGLSLAEDQRHVFRQLIDLAAGCDAVLIAGDLYNRASPNGEAVRMAGDFFSALAALGKPVYAIAGNHDGGDLVGYCADIMAGADIHLCGNYDGTLPRHVLRDAHGEVHLYLLPYVKPAQVRAALRALGEEAAIATYTDAIAAALRRTPLDTAARNVLVSHQYISGAQLSDSEERMLGGLDQIPLSLFDDFDYVAMGHLHSPQRLANGRVCYSGSPLKYALSEEHQQKGALIVELGAKGHLSVQTAPLQPLRDVRTVEGPLAEIAAPNLYSEDYVGAVVTDEDVPPDPLGALRLTYPNLISMAVRNSRTNVEMNAEQIQIAEQKNPLEHFIDFYTRQNNNTPPDARRIEIMRQIIIEAEGMQHAAD